MSSFGKDDVDHSVDTHPDLTDHPHMRGDGSPKGAMKLGQIGPFSLPSLADFSSTGIYFLHLGDQVVYVGQAKCMRQRIGQHICEGIKIFDGVSGFSCPASDLNRLERRYIRLLLPRYNRCAVAKGEKAVLEHRGVPIVQPAVDAGDSDDDAVAARFLGISIEQLREHQRLGHGPRPVLRDGRNRRRYPIGVLRKFAARYLGAGG